MANKATRILNVRDYGASNIPATGYPIVATAGSAILNTGFGLTWTSADAGKTIVVYGAGTNGNRFWSTIASVPNHTFALTAVDGAGNYTGTITGGAANAFVGYSFNITGFTNTGNNGIFTCTASTATTLSFGTTTTIETHAASATDYGYNAIMAAAATTSCSSTGGNGYTYPIGTGFWWPVGQDDTAAIQAALNDATDTGNFPNARVYLPSGQYVYSAPLTLTGYYDNASEFYGDGESTFLVLANTAGTGCIDFSGPQIHVHDLTVYGGMIDQSPIGTPVTGGAEVHLDVLASEIYNVTVLATSYQHDYYIKNSFGSIRDMFGVAQAVYALDTTTVTGSQHACWLFDDQGTPGLEGGVITGNLCGGDFPFAVATIGTAFTSGGGYGVFGIYNHIGGGGAHTAESPIAFQILNTSSIPVTIVGCQADDCLVGFQLGSNTAIDSCLSTGAFITPTADYALGSYVPYPTSVQWVTAGLSETVFGSTIAVKGVLIIDTNGNVQECTTSGNTGGTNPPTGGWNVTTGMTTTDGSAVWTNRGSSLTTLDNITITNSIASSTATWNVYNNASNAEWNGGMKTVYSNGNGGPYVATGLTGNFGPITIQPSGSYGRFLIEVLVDVISVSGGRNLDVNISYTDGGGTQNSTVLNNVNSTTGPNGGWFALLAANLINSAVTLTGTISGGGSISYNIFARVIS